MRYNEKYDLYLDDDLIIYYWDKSLDKLMQRPLHDNGHGYLLVATKLGNKYVHRVIYETFIGEIPDGMNIKHFNKIKTDNRLDNLILVAREKPHSEFGRKFKEHYGITCSQNFKLYNKEHMWYSKHNNKCRWE